MSGEGLRGAGALVTGAASGLGRAVALRLAAEGARVVGLDLAGAEPAEGIALLQGDVTSEADVMRAVAAVEGPLRAVVACAGIGPPARMVGRDGPMPLEAFERVVRVNLTGTFNTFRLAAHRMEREPPDAAGGRGAMVATASVAAFEGQVGQTAYAASKGGIVALVLPAARELARSGIRVNAVAPGLFRTPLLGNLPEAARDSLGAQVPHPPRLGEPGEFAEAVLFALTHPYLNGETVRLDGALRMAPR